MDFESEKEVKSHIRNMHKTHKPCKNFQLNQCQYAQDCSFRHIILQEGEYICYKCGNTYPSKTEMMKHVKEIHGNIICHRFLRNECTYNTRCLFSHRNQGAHAVEIGLDGSQASVIPTPTAQDFPHPPIALGPVGGRETRPQANISQVQQMSVWNHQQILTVTTQVISQLMPTIMNQITATLSNMNANLQ